MQAGPTAVLYRHPLTLEAARVFSDPPLNELALEKRDNALLTAHGERPAPAPLLGLPDGHYRMGFRADAVTLGAKPPGTRRFEGTVSVTELHGSESFVHVDVGGGAWVCLIPGVHDLLPGASTPLHIDVRRAFVFDARGALASRPVLAEAV